MINGVLNVPRVVEESTCRSAKDYKFTEIGIYKIHSTSLMTNIPFEEARTEKKNIEKSIFLNDEETLPTFNENIEVQNFLTTRYIGRAPLEWYDSGEDTKRGREFVLICKGGNPDTAFRTFGTEGAIRGYNRGANENVNLPGGGETG